MFVIAFAGVLDVPPLSSQACLTSAFVLTSVLDVHAPIFPAHLMFVHLKSEIDVRPPPTCRSLAR